MKDFALLNLRHVATASSLASSILFLVGCGNMTTAPQTPATCAVTVPNPATSKIDVSPQRNMSSASVGAMATFNVTGTAQYIRFLPVAGAGATNSKLDYTSPVTMPIRRAVVQVMSGTTVLASGLSLDDGTFSVATTADAGASIFVRVQARSVVSSYAKDSLGGTTMENCVGGSWDIKVVNNVTNCSTSQSDPTLRPIYAIDGGALTAPSSGSLNAGTLTASIAVNGSNVYTSRAGAPFALLDTAVQGLEVACEARAGIAFPELYINWSPLNTTTSGNRYAGNISTSFFTTENTASTANLYILGKEGVDTDELDRHVVAHEFGHFLENKIYRSDSVGGNHSPQDSLDPRVAFGEGFGYAFASFVYRNPVCIDTNGTGSQSGFKIDTSTAPSGDDRGVYSETSMQHMLWSLWEARDGTATSGDFTRIGAVLENSQKTTDALTNGLTFASLYAQTYTLAGEGLSTIWGTTLDSATNALCVGACGTTWDLYDSDNDLGTGYTANTRRYRQTSGSTRTAQFWQMYRTLSSGTNTATDHDVISLSTYSYSANKFGAHRFYKLTATGTSTTVSVASPSTGSCTTPDYLDMAVYKQGTRVGLDETATGATTNCPSVTFTSTPGQVYIVDIYGFGNVSSYNVVVSP